MDKDYYLQELENTLPQQIGDEGPAITRAQEWINLQKYHVPGYNITIDVDGDYGPATTAAVKEFQKHENIEQTGILDSHTWERLISPMKRAFRSMSFRDDLPFANRLVECANEHLIEHPTELPSNRGPWVRAYMDGKDGPSWAWCVGFVQTCIDQALGSLGLSLKEMMALTYSCDALMQKAESTGVHIRNSDYKETAKELVEAGDLFLVISRKNPDDARHVGIITEVGDGYFKTIEGNTNDDGSREGYEVCARIRNYKKQNLDVVSMNKWYD